LLGALFVLGDQQALARAVEIGFERDDVLVGGGEPFVEADVLVAQRLCLADLLRELHFQIDDLCAARRDINGDFGASCFCHAQQALRVGEVLTQVAALLLRNGERFLQFGGLVAQLAVGGAGIVEDAL
jgi:hypothetical protein